MTDMTRRTTPSLLLFPGAGSAADHPSLVAVERAVAPMPCVRADFPYRRAGRRAPDRAPVLLQAVREKKGRATFEKLAEEIIAAYKREGAAVTKRDNVHRMADANKAFAHFAW